MYTESLINRVDLLIQVENPRAWKLFVVFNVFLSQFCQRRNLQMYD